MTVYAACTAMLHDMEHAKQQLGAQACPAFVNILVTKEVLEAASTTAVDSNRCASLPSVQFSDTNAAQCNLQSKDRHLTWPDPNPKTALNHHITYANFANQAARLQRPRRAQAAAEALTC